MRMRIPQTDKDDDKNFFVDQDRNSSIKHKDDSPRDKNGGGPSNDDKAIIRRRARAWTRTRMCTRTAWRSGRT
jgi:hypothetical protein